MKLQVCPTHSSIIEREILLFHDLGTFLLVRVFHLLVKVEKFLVQQPIQQFEILQTSLDIAVFLEPIFSSADVVQHILDFVVAKTSSACSA